MTTLERWKQRARNLKIELYALYLAYRDPRVPWYARVFAACVVGYAFSPIDLIPDPIPVLGYFDDLILVPLGIILALHMIPTELMMDCRERARATTQAGQPTNWVAAGIIIFVWVLLAALAVLLVWRAVGR